MPAAIFDIDITRMFPDVNGLHASGAAHVLFRLHGRPLAWTTAAVKSGRLERDALVRGLLEQHAWSCAVPLAERAILSGAPPRCLDVTGLLQVPPPRPARGPLVTVAVCNAGAAESLRRCLIALHASDYPDIDVLVIDTSADGAQVETMLQDYPRPVRYVRERNGAQVLRRATAECRGDILATTTADAVPDPRWVSALVHVFLADPEVMVATGPILPDRTGAPLAAVAHENGVSRRWWRHRGPLPPVFQIGQSANVAWWHTALDAGRGFEGRAAFWLVYEPSAIVHATVAPGGGSVVPAARDRGRVSVFDCAIDLADPLRPIDTGTRDALVLHVSWSGRPLGQAHTTAGGWISPLQVTDAVAHQLTATVLDAALGVGERVCRALVTADLARFVVARHGGSLQWMHAARAASAVA